MSAQQPHAGPTTVEEKRNPEGNPWNAVEELDRLLQAADGLKAGSLTFPGMWHYAEIARRALSFFHASAGEDQEIAPDHGAALAAVGNDTTVVPAAQLPHDADPTWRCHECGASNSKSHAPECRWELVDRTPVSPEPPDMTRVAEYPPTTVARIYWREGWAEGYRAALIAMGRR